MQFGWRCLIAASLLCGTNHRARAADAPPSDTADVLAIVGGSIVVSPVACFEGLPADFHLDAYLLGVVAPTKDALDEVVATVGRTAIFEGQVRTMCLD